ncbi:MAG: hypothetical protein KHY85_02050 [Clostridium sp.]|uniref:hypothetical protein n=1 Tax=Anaerotignum lactatifermentans TaxID=160404 RepID=UPI003AEFD2FF|nr:hypothetical protein [Clostridium sp.]
MQEKNIIDAIKAGDEQAMQKIICRYSRLLWSIVGAVLSQWGPLRIWRNVWQMYSLIYGNIPRNMMKAGAV